MDKKEANKIYNILKKSYPKATTALTHKDALQLLVATILSAQCTDKRVNIVTKELFKKYKKASDFAKAKGSTFEKEIRSTGFYKNKAKNIIQTAKVIEKDYKGKVPSAMEELTRLPGVARKTANIVLFHAFGKNEGIAVDTHVKRVSGRMGLTKKTDPKKIEEDLMKLFDRKKWGHLTNIFIAHGRAICDAKKPLCAKCPIKKLCPSANKLSKK
jgi:endonuclease-3